MNGFRASFLALIFVPLSVPSQASASGPSCPQSIAVYGSGNGLVAIEFSGAEDLSFAMLIESGPAYAGFVYPAEIEGAADAVVLDNCPDGDVTGDEITACTVWQGRLEAIAADGTVEAFSLSGGLAVAGLRMDGLAGALARRIPDMNAEPARAETETLTLSACQE
ncbi:MAG: hypothetical protein AAF724_19720 [Pseudomonadota bacterium]